MGLFDNLRQRLVPARKKEPKMSGRLLFGELGEAGTNNTSGFINEDFNSKFNESSAIDIYDEMRKTDATVAATLKALKLPILAAGRLYAPASDSPKDIEIAEFVRLNLEENMKGGMNNHLLEALGHKDFGFWYFEKVYELKDGQIFLKILASRQPSAHFRWMMQTTPEIPGITQQLPTETPESARHKTFGLNPEIPRSKLVLYTNAQEGENWAGTSVLRSAYIHWYFKNKLYRIDGIKHERGAGILKILLPESSTEEDKAAAAELGRNWKINESSYIVAPNPEWDISLMTAGISDQTSGLGNSVKHHDHEIEKNILASFLGLGGDGGGGSFALSENLSSFFTLGLKETAKYMANVINEDLIKELVDLNFGPQKKYPKLVFTQIGEVDIAKMSAALKTLTEAGVVDVDDEVRVWARETFDLPELSLEEAAERREEREGKEKEEAASQRDLEMQKINKGQVDVADEEEEEVNEKREAVKEEDEAELAEPQKKKFKPFRELTLAEGRVKFAELRDFFNGTEKEIKEMLANLTEVQRDKLVNQINDAIQSGDIGAIGKARLTKDSDIRKELKTASKEAFEEGKRNAANEAGVSLPTTPAADTQLRNSRIEQAVEDRARDIEANVKNKGLDLARKGVGAAAALFALRKAFDAAAGKQNAQLVGRTVASNVNAGRSLVIDKNKQDIHALQRSEILDERTCAMCLSIDGRIVEKDDPFAKIDQVHTHCRGIWVIIKKTDADLPTPKPIPKNISSRFETVDGVPTANNFKQLPKPIINKTSRVAEKVRRGTIDNPNLEN